MKTVGLVVKFTLGVVVPLLVGVNVILGSFAAITKDRPHAGMEYSFPAILAAVVCLVLVRYGAEHFDREKSGAMVLGMGLLAASVAIFFWPLLFLGLVSWDMPLGFVLNVLPIFWSETCLFALVVFVLGLVLIGKGFEYFDLRKEEEKETEK